jgi:hypothetical protein
VSRVGADAVLANDASALPERWYGHKMMTGRRAGRHDSGAVARQAHLRE